MTERDRHGPAEAGIHSVGNGITPTEGGGGSAAPSPGASVDGARPADAAPIG
jgi:hypothetical protein